MVGSAVTWFLLLLLAVDPHHTLARLRPLRWSLNPAPLSSLSTFQWLNPYLIVVLGLQVVLVFRGFFIILKLVEKYKVSSICDIRLSWSWFHCAYFTRVSRDRLYVGFRSIGFNQVFGSRRLYLFFIAVMDLVHFVLVCLSSPRCFLVATDAAQLVDVLVNLVEEALFHLVLFIEVHIFPSIDQLNLGIDV